VVTPASASRSRSHSAATISLPGGLVVSIWTYWLMSATARSRTASHLLGAFMRYSSPQIATMMIP